MSLEKKGPDWAGAGWDWTGGDDDRIRVPRPLKPVDAQFQDFLKACGLEMTSDSETHTYKLVELKDLEEIQKALEVAHATLQEQPELDTKKFAELSAKSKKAFDETIEKMLELHRELTDLRSKYHYNILRAFGAGVLLAWIAWTIFGGPS